MDLYCAIIYDSRTKIISKIITKDLNIILSGDIIIVFTILKQTRGNKNKLEFDIYLDYWFGTHNENIIYDRIVNHNDYIKLHKQDLNLIKTILINTQNLIKILNQYKNTLTLKSITKLKLDLDTSLLGIYHILFKKE